MTLLLCTGCLVGCTVFVAALFAVLVIGAKEDERMEQIHRDLM